MKDPRDIILKPVVSEKSYSLIETGVYTFVVDPKASKPEILKDPVTEREAQVAVSDDHMGNFFECVRTREQPDGDAEVGHRSASLCHLGGIALRLGRKLKWDPAKEEFIADKVANGHLAREQRKPWTYDAV